MELTVNAVTLSGTSQNFVLLQIPDACPRCHRSILAMHVAAYSLAHRDLVQVIFRCTSQACEEVFIATYQKLGGMKPPQCVFLHLAPINPLMKESPETVAGVSPSFVEIYNQALAAEAAGLTQMVGIGLRKALEFLIKDFAIKQNPGKEEEIKQRFLGQCIDNYIDDSNVKACAKRAAWLGNDETHYIRKWEDKDVTDLKRLIHLTVNGIDNILVTEQYATEMDEAGPQSPKT